MTQRFHEIAVMAHNDPPIVGIEPRIVHQINR